MAMTAEGTDTAGAPSPGQLVTVRNRIWVAADVWPASVASADVTEMSARPQHLVALVSIEDDARDESLRVVWELEPGAVVHERAALPTPADGFDEPAQLDAFLDAVRWGAIASADTTALQAPFRSGVDVDPYQLDPVVRALSMPRTNLLIADDVGLGKTIEAGLVMQELTLRHRARTMLIVCPAGLTLQWRDEMRDKFGLDFRIVDTALVKELRRERGRYANPWTHYPRLIVSIDWLKRDRPMRSLREVLPDAPRYPRAFDLLVVDEVHTCAPAGHGRYAVDSRRTTAVRTLAPHCEHRLFLSATPHNGYLESFTALLELLDDQRFARGVRPAPEQLARVMVRRLKRELPAKWDGSPRFAVRELDYLEVTHSADERRTHQLLERYAAGRRAADGAARAHRTATDFVVTLLKKRLLSSPKAFAETVDAHLTTVTARGESGPALRDRGDAVAQRVLRPMIERVEETAEDDASFGEVAHQALDVAGRITAPLTAGELALLRELRDRARAVSDRPDSKFETFLAWSDAFLRPGGVWSDQRLIVFTEYRDTQRWLHERLLGAGYPPGRVGLLYGGQDPEEREHVKNVFTESTELDDMRVLLATDAASEGINLQRHCHRLLHWEIPWNPNRLEQRNGRIDRRGQPAPRVDVLHFVPAGWQRSGEQGAAGPDAELSAGTLDDELGFLAFAARKVDQIREDLGSAGDVIAAQVEQKMLGRRTDWQGADAEIERRAGRAELRVKHELNRELQRLSDALTGSRTELNLTPATVQRVVRVALRLAHGKDLIDADPPPGLSARCFWLPELTGAWAQARNDGLFHPLTGKERPITFDDAAVGSRTDVVLAHLGHRLVQMCLRLLRAELWARAGGGGAVGAARISRVTARVVPGDTLFAPAVVAHGRVVVTGGQGTRLHEEIVYAGGTLDGGTLRRAREEEVTAWLAAASEQPVPEPLRTQLAGMWDKLAGPLDGALRQRSESRKRSMHKLLATRCEEEVAAVREVLAELERQIRTALDDHEHWEQGSLFTVDTERDQLRKDRDALRARLAELPGLLDRETEALRRRYADPAARSFPAAVTFLVPEKIAKGAH